MLKTPNISQLPKFLKSIEAKWISKRINQNRTRKLADDGSQKPIYILSMFPYPSGRLHLGHARCYTSADIISRFCTLMGKPTINPMGFDSFGLPAENAARERQLDPAVWTNTNIRTMKKQLDDLGIIFDWREATSNPNYYKWTQDIFLKLYDANLIYKSYSKVNWDPVDKTVLADEQVDEEGRSWRSGAKVEKINCKQWFVKVSAFTNALYQAEDVDPDHWGDILSIQRNWVGKPNGYMFYLPVMIPGKDKTETLLVFVKRPELFLQPEAKLLISKDHWLELEYGISDLKYIKNPFNNTKLELQFASSNDQLPSNCNATLEDANVNFDHDNETDQSTEHLGDNLSRNQVLLQASLNNLGGYRTNSNYRDWLISRQRFWGTPIPMIKLKNGQGYRAVERNNLPVKLPKLSFSDSNNKLENSSDKNSSRDELMELPLQKYSPREWLEIRTKDDQLEGLREAETLDTMFDSSWYFLRYASDPPSNEPFNRLLVQPVWCYIGGKEHAYMHLFYARFMTHFLNSIGLLPFKEPFKKLLVQGQVKSKTYKINERYVSPSEFHEMKSSSKLDLEKDKIEIEYEKMSKSKGNGVDPENLLDKFGIDATRLCLISYANPRSERLWRSDSEEFKDVFLFLRRVILTVEEFIVACDNRQKNLEQNSESEDPAEAANLEDASNKLKAARNRLAIDSTVYIHETNEFRQYLSAMHVALGCLRNHSKDASVLSLEFAKLLASLLIVMNPVAPHLTEELWFLIGKTSNALNDGRYLASFSANSPNTITDNHQQSSQNEENNQIHLNLLVRDQRWPSPDPGYLNFVNEHRQNLYTRAMTSLAS